MTIYVNAVHSPDEALRGRREALAGRTLTIGRDGDWSAADHAMSRRHVRIGGDDESVWVEDLDSKNGTWLHGQRLGDDAGQRTLDLDAGPAIVRVGDTVLAVERLDGDVPNADAGDAGAHPLFRGVLANLDQVAASDATVLLRGEAGSDKAGLAAYVHEHSGRQGAFVTRGGGMCDAGAMVRALGEAIDGTLFVDDVAELSEQAQQALQLALEDGELKVRLVAGTSRELLQAADDGLLRRDLLATLSG